ncbi:hypothetical protein KXV63_004706 [Aspergillus fumigatus]|nr:hypothetical protein KXV63_004706 [Aspergillus fumigatus]
MDRSLDEIIAERPQKQNRGRRPPQGQGRRRDGVKKLLGPPSSSPFEPPYRNMISTDITAYYDFQLTLSLFLRHNSPTEKNELTWILIGSTTDMTTTETVRFEPGFVAIVTGDFLFIPLVCFNTGFFQHALLVVPDVHAVTVTPHRPIGMSGLDLLLKPFVVMAANSCSSAPAGAKIRVENLHYDITESDLEDLFNRIGPVSNLSLVYDRAGRSEGVAYVTYNRANDARTAIAEFDGANAKGQPIRLTLVASGPGRRGRNPFDNVERLKGSLFDRIERPRDARSLSPGSENGDVEGGARRRRGRRSGGGAGHRRSDVSKPAPEHIDRYVPGQRSPVRRSTNGRRQGERRDDRNRGEGRRNPNARPKKTQEELDQEMDDYWGGANAGAGAADKEVVQDEPQQIAPATSAAAGDDDVDMIE